MTVERLIELLQNEVAKGNGHMPVGIALGDEHGITISAGLFERPKIGVSEQYDMIWVIGRSRESSPKKKI